MQCTVIADNIKRAVSVIERVVSKDQSLPVLCSYLVSADKNAITITGTNLEVGIQILIRGTVGAQGQCVIPARQLSGYISTLAKDEKITIESENNNTRITAGPQETTFNGYPPEDYPPFPSARSTHSFVCNKRDMLDALARTIFSTSKTTIKPELASINMLFEREMLIVAATDSFRLSEERIKPTSFSPKLSKTSFLLPIQSAEELARLLEYSDDEQAEFFIGKGEARITSNNATLYSRLTEGLFPDYQQIIPQKFTTHLTIRRAELVAHIRRASVFANKLFGISLTFNPKDKTLTLESKNSFGTHRAGIGVDIHGEPISVVFNYHYLLDGIESYGDDTLFIGLNGESQPLVVHPPKKDTSIYVVMPMKGGA